MKLKEYIIIPLMLIPILFFKFLGLNIIMNLIFFIIIFGIFIVTLWFRNQKTNKTLEEIKIINEKLKENNSNINEIFLESVDLNKIWNDYKEKMFEDKNHIDPEEYFNTTIIINSNINLGWFSYIPNLFITIGIMGTFLGLSIGLKQLIVVDIFSISNEILSTTIKELLKNVSTSFYTSLYGMYYSVLFNIENTRFFSKYENEIEILNIELRKRYFYNLELEKIEEIRKELVIQNQKIDELDKKLAIQHSKTDEIIKEFKLQNNISKEIKQVLDVEVNKSETIIDRFIDQNQKVDELDKKLVIQHSKTDEIIKEFKLQNNTSKEIIEILKVEVEKSNELINKFTTQNIFVDEMLTKIKSMVKTFEAELRGTLKLVFNDEYVTEMNKIQTDFIMNSKNLSQDFLKNNTALSRQFDVLRNENQKSMDLINRINFLTDKITLFAQSIDNTSNIINKIKEQLFVLSDKYYSKEQLEKMITILNHSIDTNKKNLLEISEKYRTFKDEMAISLSTFYQNFRKLDYHDLKETIKQTADISNRNKEMVEKYFDFYNNLKYNNALISQEYEKMAAKLKELYEQDNITYAKNIEQLFKNKNTFDYLNETLEVEVQKYRESLSNLNRFSFELKNNTELKNEINELNEKIESIYNKIEDAKEYINLEKNRKNKKVLFRKYGHLGRGKANDKKK